MGIVVCIVLLELVFVFAYLTERSPRLAYWLNNLSKKIDL